MAKVSAELEMKPQRQSHQDNVEYAKYMQLKAMLQLKVVFMVFEVEHQILYC